MTTLHEQARAEAEKRRYLFTTPDEGENLRSEFVAGAVWAATRTRVVTTVAELDALPDGTVMRARNEALREMGTLRDGTRVVWAEGWSLLDDAVKYDAPFTVLHEPEETP